MNRRGWLDSLGEPLGNRFFIDHKLIRMRVVMPNIGNESSFDGSASFRHHHPVRISSRSGDVVLMSAEDYDAWQETVYLLRSPANARRLMEAVARDRAGAPPIAKTMDELREMVGGEE
jgi:antitoxin YefM